MSQEGNRSPADFESGPGTELLVLGSGSQAKYVIDIADTKPTLEVVGLVDLEDPERIGKEINGVPIVSAVTDLEGDIERSERELVVAYGDNERKQRVVEAFSKVGGSFVSVVSPDAYVSSTASVQDGVIVNPSSTVLPNAVLEAHSIVHSHVTVEHDCRVGRYANLAPGVQMGGRVTVGERAYLFTGCNIAPDTHIGADAVVGAGATVLDDVDPGQTVVGAPAEPVSEEGNGS